MITNARIGARPAMGRRAFGRLLAGTGLTLATLSFGASRSFGAGQPTYYTWEGYDTPELFDAYAKADGALPLLQSYSDENEALENLSAGMPVDVAHPCADTLPHWRDAGLLQPIDVSRLSHWPDLIEPLRTIPGINDGGETWFVPIDWGTTSVIYRTDLVQIEEESYNLLWDERYAGKLAFGEDVTESVIMAALAAGVTDPFNMSDADLQLVRDALTRQHDLLKYYWSDPSVIVDDLKAGNLVATSGWSDTYFGLKEEGVPVAYMAPKEGILSWCCGAVLLKSATEIDQSYKLMDHLISPDAGAWFLGRHAGHANLKTLELASPDTGLPYDPVELLSTSTFLRVSPRLADYQMMFDEVRGVS